MKLLTPRSRGQSVWAFTSSFGGGLVAGDQTEFAIEVGREARCFVGTQASTKVYRNPSGLPSGHRTSAKLEAGAVLVFAPDPVQAFAQSSYTQRQEFFLQKDSSLILVDWVTAGRTARGERWDMDFYHSRSDVFVDDRRVFVDSLLLEPEVGSLKGTHRLGRFNCVATVAFFGPATESARARVLARIAEEAVVRQAECLMSGSPIADGVVARFAGSETERVGRMMQEFLRPMTELLGDDPWARKW